MTTEAPGRSLTYCGGAIDGETSKIPMGYGNSVIIATVQGSQRYEFRGGRMRDGSERWDYIRTLGLDERHNQ